MRIGLEVSNATTRHATGVSRYIMALVAACAAQMTAQDHLTLFYKLSRWPRRQGWWRPAGLPVRLYHSWYWPPVKGVDLVHGLDCVVPSWTRVPRLVTCHDLLTLASDDAQIAPERFRQKKRQLYQAAAAGADAIITVSATTRRDVIELLGVPEARVYVTHLGIDPRFRPHPPEAVQAVCQRYRLAPGYVLFTGSISGRKNTARLVRAYAQSRASAERPLVLAGTMAYRSEDTLEAIHQCAPGTRVQLLGYVPDTDLPALYAGAGCFAFPTLYEGFGMPILEAMASGIPVLTSTTGAAPEISAGLAVCVDPYDIEAIAAGIDRALATPATTLAQARVHASTFTWERCARRTLDIYRQVLCTTHNHPAPL
jgi:alpha-1,3-rhamnosyl/mannosyltransferase